MSIPHVIHRLWLGPRPMPERFRDYGREWERLNPGWTCHDWSWHDLPENLANGDILDDIWARCTRGDSIELATALADVIDYDLVARFGGIYMNTDMQPVRPLPPELSDGRAWAARESPRTIVNAAMGGPPEHPFWRAVVDELPGKYWPLRNRGNINMVETTGPHHLTEMCDHRPDVHIAHKNVFSYLILDQVQCGRTADGLWDMDTLPPEVVAIHHWDHRRTGRTNEVT